MSTRRSQHNYGRKPMYKEHRQNWIAPNEIFTPAENIGKPTFQPIKLRSRTSPEKSLAELARIIQLRMETPAQEIKRPETSTEYMERKRRERAIARREDPDYRGSGKDLMWDGGNPFRTIYLRQLVGLLIKHETVVPFMAMLGAHHLHDVMAECSRMSGRTIAFAIMAAEREVERLGIECPS